MEKDAGGVLVFALAIAKNALRSVPVGRLAGTVVVEVNESRLSGCRIR